MSPIRSLGLVAVAFAYAAYSTTMKCAAERMHPLVGAVVLQIVAAIVGGVAIFFIRDRGTLHATSSGIVLAAVAGVAVAAAEVGSFYLLKIIPLNVANPIIIGGWVAFAAIGGGLLLRESLRAADVLAIGGMICCIAVLLKR